MLTLTNVSTNYGKIPMLRNVNMRVDPGEVVCILGANGAGKTTTLKTILGLVRPVSGTICFKEQRIDNMPTHRIVASGISMVPQGEGLFPKMTVESNLRLGAYFERDESKIRSRLERVFGLFPRLRERLSQKAGTLSGGERTMLSIARGLLSEPELILMDEPSLGLAPVLVDEVFKSIAQIKAEKKVTILLVEQNAKKALSVADRGYIMQKGQIVLEGTTDELLNSNIVRQSYLHVERAKVGR